MPRLLEEGWDRISVAAIRVLYFGVMYQRETDERTGMPGSQGRVEQETQPHEPQAQRLRRPRMFIPIVLFALTVATTTMANGPLYSAAVMGILLFHEMGHFVACRRYGVVATLPHFIPLPPQISFIGTLGAVIAMKPKTADRRTLFDIGIAGPLAGFVLAVPVTIWGLSQSQVVAGLPGEAGLFLGESLLFRLLEWITLGPLGDDSVVMLHPVALAGWTGLFVTGLNLIPAGMLDGGHIVYGLLGRKSIYVAYGVMVGLAILALKVFVYWWVWFGLLLVLRVVHPAHRFGSRPIDGPRIALGVFALVLFIVCFIPVPISFTP